MKRTLPKILQFISARNRTKPNEFFSAPGIRLLVLCNEARLNPKNKDIEIERAKLWNADGDVWLEIERWGVETHQVETNHLYIDTAENLKTREINFDLNEEAITIFEETAAEGLTLDKTSIKLLQYEVSARVVAKLEKIGKTRPTKPAGTTLPEVVQEPFIYFNYPSVLHTLMRFSKTRDDQPDHYVILEEEKEGTLAALAYELFRRDGKYYGGRHTQEPIFKTFTHAEATVPFDLLSPGERYMPLDTLLTLLEEQMTWANWLYRTSPTPLDALELSRYIHKSGDYQEIFQYLRKDQLRDWETRIHRASNDNLLALLLSAATVPDLNQKISAKMIRHQLGPSLFRVFYKGGLLNQTLFKYAWVFGWAQPLPNLTADQIQYSN